MYTYLVDHMYEYTQFRLAENSTLPDIPERKYCPSRPVPVATQSKAYVYKGLPAEIVGSNPTGGMDVCRECCVLSGRGLCDARITRSEESYRLWRVAVCDLETTRMRRPWPRWAAGPQKYIYRVSQEECARLRESVPYVKVYRYNPKHLYSKLNGYGDNGQRSLKIWQLLHTYWLPNTY